MADETTEAISKEVRSIIESLCKILSLKKDIIHDLDKMDRLAFALTGEMMSSMLNVPLQLEGDDFSDPGLNENYLKDLLKAGEDSFIQHKGSDSDLGWIDILASNQDKMVGIFAGGLVS
tara:strand:+ start:446 stop:802 length:357 start_codon:yes stop_codon:yes gene_type:complete